jgi:hypothetical protein
VEVMKIMIKESERDKGDGDERMRKTVDLNMKITIIKHRESGKMVAHSTLI